MKKIMVSIQVAALAMGAAFAQPAPPKVGTLHVTSVAQDFGCVDPNAIVLCPYYNPSFPGLQWFFCYCFVPPATA